MDSQGHDIQSPGAGRTVEGLTGLAGLAGLAGRRILLGITGSIAAYKAAVLCRLLKCAGAEVRVVMTPLAKQFITPLTMATLSKNPILVEFFDPENGAWNSHVSLGEWADCYLIAPATANTLAKMACGIADNLLLTTYLSARCPVVVSPAMDLDMYAHPATQENLRRLAERGVRIVQPAEGELASGLTGKGRMRHDRSHRPRAVYLEPLVGQDGLRHCGRTGRPRRRRDARQRPYGPADARRSAAHGRTFCRRNVRRRHRGFRPSRRSRHVRGRRGLHARYRF